MLPNAHHLPADRLQLVALRDVTSDVAIQLGTPIVGVGLRRDAVQWTAMPEAAINEYCDPLTGEHDIDANSLLADSYRVIFAKAKADAMQLRAEP